MQENTENKWMHQEECIARDILLGHVYIEDGDIKKAEEWALKTLEKYKDPEQDKREFINLLLYGESKRHINGE